MSSNDDIPIDVFDAIQTEIYFLMKRDSFKKFIEHPLFEQTYDFEFSVILISF